MIPKKCPLCSKLSSAFERLLRRSLTAQPTASLKGNTTSDELLTQESSCQQLNTSSLEEKERVSAFSKACPDCICEKYRSSTFSPAVVQDSENLARFVFSPIHLDRRGTKIKPSVFSHISTKGCSIQRESVASDSELADFLASYLKKNPTHSWYGTLTASCEAVRGVLLNGQTKRALCVYDMAEEHNPAHGEIHQSQYVIEESDMIELRAELFRIFNGGAQIHPKEYRGGILSGENIRSSV